VSLVTGEGVQVSLPYAALPSRLLAAAIDLGLQSALALGLGTGLGLVLGKGVDPALARALLVVLIAACYLGLPTLTTAARGWTVGKLVLGLRVTRDDGGPVGLREAFGRELVGIVVEKPGALLGLPALVCMLARPDGKRVGDLVSGTVVLSTRVARAGHVSAVAMPRMPDGLESWAASVDLARLDDALARQTRDLLTRAARLTPAAREQALVQVSTNLESALGPRPPQLPVWTWLAAVVAEGRRRDVARLLAQRVAPGFGVPAWDRPNQPDRPPDVPG
jgi:uncharacterized RDD family membrane protein YckC